MYFLYNSVLVLFIYSLQYIICVYLQVIAFDELKTDCKHPIEQCDSLNPVSGIYLQMQLIIFNIFIMIHMKKCFLAAGIA